MKAKIHPQYFEKAKITCACGKKYTIGSTEESIQVEICANCHPLYTGKQKIVDAARRVEKFQAKVAQKAGKTTVGKKAKRAKRAAGKSKKEAKDSK